MTRVIFACIDGGGRSQMAAAFFNQLADHARARASAAGRPVGDGACPQPVAEVMREVGLEPFPAPSPRLTGPLVAGARHLVTLGCAAECPFFAGVKVQDWPVGDPKGEPVERLRQIRDEIRRRVESMIEINGWRQCADARTGTRG